MAQVGEAGYQGAMAPAAFHRLAIPLAAALFAFGLAIPGHVEKPPAYGPSPNPRRPSGVCYRTHERGSDAVLVSPSGDADLDDAILSIFAEGRYPGRGEGHKRVWYGVYGVQVAGPMPAVPPDCSDLPPWPSQDLEGRPLQARWNVPMSR